jgi:hypothetical protein
MPAKNVKETRVYKLAFELAMEIFNRSDKTVIEKCVYLLN